MTTNQRKLFPMWRITGSIQLNTPLSIGSGHDEAIELEEKDGTHTRFVAAITRDHQGKPYIPASSLKGALKALAQQTDMEDGVQAQLFGGNDGDTTIPAKIEFCNVYASKLCEASSLPHWSQDKHTAHIPHASRDRNCGTALDQHLYLEQVVPADTCFTFECTARAIDESDIQALLGLLELAGSHNSPLRLGGSTANNNGSITWTTTEVRYIPNHTTLWSSLLSATESTINIWTDNYSEKKVLSTQTLTIKPNHWLQLEALELKFNTPFLVYQHQPKKENNTREPDGKPRQNARGKYILPASSLHGALRSQAERILRTIGKVCPNGYEVPAARIDTLKQSEDLASIIFGAPNWQSILRISDFVVTGTPKLITQDMVAIDRITGGGKDSAKFDIQALDCPTLKGNISINWQRLTHNFDTTTQQKILGLLAHTLRDLDEGDIPLGYGAAKGYGQSTSTFVDTFVEELLSKNHQLDDCLLAFSKFAKETIPEQTTEQPTGTQQEPTAPNGTNNTTGFHNPYVFIPFGTPNTEKWTEYADIKKDDDTPHSHARYAPNTFNGRITCRLTTKTPIFIGAGESKDANDTTEQEQYPNPQANFELNSEIALPATSLRGMCSSLHESLTCSAVRVMDNKPYSVRATTEEALPKQGILMQEEAQRKDGTKTRAWKILETDTHKKYFVTPTALKRLERLCDERTEATQDDEQVLPELKPKGIARNINEQKYGKKIRLVEGQKTYFDVDADNKVTEMAYSQIWRKEIVSNPSKERWTGDQALPDSHIKQLAGTRLTLSPSELLFGCVENIPKGTKTSKPARAFASKVRFGFARAKQTVQLENKITLKILASPKPPSPAMYFKPKQGNDRYISKQQLAQNASNFQFRGRKTYLHALRDTNGAVQKLSTHGNPDNAGELPWQTQSSDVNAKQKVSIRPIAADQQFEFAVDFINLNKEELAALCASLVPHSSYEHKLGMGKPIGLGSVKIDITKMELINRQQRYTQTNFNQDPAVRYHETWDSQEHANQAANNPIHLANQHMQQLKDGNPEVFNAVLLTGNPQAVTQPVHYPQRTGLDLEEKTYEWFVENDKRNHVGQHLASFTNNTTTLPTLTRNHQPKPRNRHR